MSFSLSNERLMELIVCSGHVKWAMGIGQLFSFFFSLFFVFLDLDYLVKKKRTELAWLYGSYCRLLELPSFM